MRDRLEGVGAEDIRPSGGKLGGSRDPEALFGMVNNQDAFVCSGADIPGTAKERNGAGRTHAARDVQGKMQVQEFFVRHLLQF